MKKQIKKKKVKTNKLEKWERIKRRRTLLVRKRMLKKKDE